MGRVQTPPCWEHRAQSGFPQCLASSRASGSWAALRRQYLSSQFVDSRWGSATPPSRWVTGECPLGSEPGTHPQSAGTSRRVQTCLGPHCSAGQDLWGSSYPCEVSRPLRGVLWGEFELSSPVYCPMLGHLQVTPQLPQASVCLSGHEEPQPQPYLLAQLLSSGESPRETINQRIKKRSL